MILEMILYMQLHRDMGRKSLKVNGLSGLGMRVMKVELIAPFIFPNILHASMNLSKYSPRISKKSK